MSQEEIDAILKNAGQTQSSSSAGADEVTAAEVPIQPNQSPAETAQVTGTVFEEATVVPPTTNSSTDIDNIDFLMDVPLDVSVELGRSNIPLRDMLQLGPGSVIELDKLIGEPVDLLVNNRLIARGEVVVFDENFGIRITDILKPEDRIKMLR